MGTETGDELSGARWGEVEIRRAHRGWRVVIPCEGGDVLEYRYARRRQAAYYASIFRLGPTWLPPPHRVRNTVAHSPFGGEGDAHSETLEDAVQRALDAAFGEAGSNEAADFF